MCLSATCSLISCNSQRWVHEGSEGSTGCLRDWPQRCPAWPPLSQPSTPPPHSAHCVSLTAAFLHTMCQASLERFKKGWAPGDETNIAILLLSVRNRRLHRQAYDRVGAWRSVTQDCLCWSCKGCVIGVRQIVLTPHPALWLDLVPTGSWDTLLIWTRESSTTPS